MQTMQTISVLLSFFSRILLTLLFFVGLDSTFGWMKFFLRLIRPRRRMPDALRDGGSRRYADACFSLTTTQHFSFFLLLYYRVRVQLQSDRGVGDKAEKMARFDDGREDYEG